MTNLTNTNNIYADLSQAAYTGRNTQFAYSTTKWNNEQIKKYNKGESVSFYFPNAKDAYGNNADKVYLQPDPTVKTIKEQPAFPLVNAPATINSYQKGLLTDEKTA
jgi:hypothetical protein